MRPIVILMFLIFSPTVNSAEFSPKHKVKPGEVISADVINELFDQVKLVSKVVESEDLVGSWRVTQTTCKDGVPGNCTGSGPAHEGYSLNPDNITRSRTGTVQIEANGGGTYSYQNSGFASLTSNEGPEDRSGTFVVIDGSALFQDSVTGSSFFYVRRTSDTRFVLSILNPGSSSYNLIRLDKLQLPPAAPKDLSASDGSSIVTLAWNDDSQEEDGFIVYRRDSLKGEYVGVGLVGGFSVLANTTSFVDSQLSPGDYWYRVSAKNINGESVRSNAVKVTIK